MPLTDSQLMLLEQLTYLNDAVYRAAGVSKYSAPETVEELLSVFTGEALETLESAGEELYNTEKNGYVQADEWAATIRALKQDKDIYTLKIGETYPKDSSTKLGLCFIDPNDSNSAYVAFKGTTGGNEWYDNAQGLGKTDTDSQKEAFAYIESLPYGNITVAGHSKGGNKAMYVAVLSEKVTRCVAMDGQGFSKEFIEKYWAEIQQKGMCITNYSLDDDYVHILLMPIPNSNQVFCTGYNDSADYYGLDNHSPNSYFRYEEVMGMDGEIRKILVLDNGLPAIEVDIKENEGMTYLHEFTNFIVNVMPLEDKEKIAEYLGVILYLTPGFGSQDDKSISYNGKTITHGMDMLEFLLSDPECLSIVLAYVLKYIETYNLTGEEAQKLIEAFGLQSLLDKLTEAINDMSDLEKIGLGALIGVGGITVSFLLSQLTDGEDDKIISYLLQKLQEILVEEGYDIPINIDECWRMIEKEYVAIGEVNAKTANKNAVSRTGRVRDFSKNSYTVLMDAVNGFESIKMEDVSSWKNYAGESWFGALLISMIINAVNTYIEYLSQVNSDCRQKIDDLYQDVARVDKSNSNLLNVNQHLFKTIRKRLFSLKNKFAF